MKLRAFALLLILALGLLAAPVPVEGQQAGKVYRTGYMSVPSRESVEDVIQIFLRALRERGWIEGENLMIEWRWADGKVERLPGFAKELVQLKPDLIVTPQTDSALAAKNVTRTIPIVFFIVEDPVASGLVASLARPGGNLAGLTITPSLEIYGKHVQLLKETLPNASRVAVLRNLARAAVNAPILREVERAARSLGLELQIVGVRGPEEFDRAFEEIARARPDALYVHSGSMFWQHRHRLAMLEAKYRLATMHSGSAHVEAGSLLSHHADGAELLRRAAAYVDKILKGAKPADLPVEQPTKFELWINLETAEALGLTIPDSILLQADRVIK